MAKFPLAVHGQPTPLPTKLPTVSIYMEVVGSLLSCPLRCTLFQYMEVVGGLICMAKFPWAAQGKPTPLPTCSPRAAKWAAPLFSYGSGQPYLHGKISMGSPWVAHSTAHWAAHFFTFGSSWLPTELPTVSIYGSGGQSNLHGKIPMGSPLRCPLSCPLLPYMEVVGSLLSCPLSCPLFPYMEVVSSLICMAKFPWAAHWQPTPLPTCSPRAGTWAAPLFFFSVWVTIVSPTDWSKSVCNRCLIEGSGSVFVL